ncbi:MAG: type II glyceraldehyde-3-phosphate dehydrogenase [Candidatus Thermoplasmatota archaeon]|nr:type II glyceraldehyde-3-phosphate dehydrogenase [Candidatus Thermoplasmatota archaeon]
MTVRVAINGYGTIGKRVADAVQAQEDMTVVGVTKTRPTFEARLALEKGFDLFVAIRDNIPKFEASGLRVCGDLDALLGKCDVVIDCTPGKMGAQNLDLYKLAGVKSIFQGGEKHDLTGRSFNSLSNYGDNLGADHVRVVSCNTTGLTRTLYPLHRDIGIDKVYATMIRRGVDPNDDKKGPMNSIIPVLKVPSHHGPDVKTVIPGLDIDTTAVAVPTTLMHLHSVVVKLRKNASTEEVLDIWDRTPRVRFVSGEDGITSTSKIMEMARDMQTSRSDLMDIAVWKDGVHVIEGTLYYYQAIHQESDVVPENIDCIRAMFELTRNNMESILKTNMALMI